MKTAFLFLALLAAAAPTRATEPLAVQPGERIKAKGEWTGDHALRAASVRHKDAADRDFEIAAAIDERDGETGAFRLAGVWVDPEQGELDRRSRQIARRLESGDWVKAEGHFEPDGRLAPTSLERLDGEDVVAAVEGTVETVEPGADGTSVVRIGPISVALGAAVAVEANR
jgi:hypothetical protein